jgi:hypothetical protein
MDMIHTFKRYFFNLILILGVCILLRVRDPGDGGFIPSTQRYQSSKS